MTNFQLYQEISALPPHSKLAVINFIKKITNSSNSSSISNYELTDYLPTSYVMEPEVKYQRPLLDLLLNGPTFTEKQLKKITDSRNL